VHTTDTNSKRKRLALYAMVVAITVKKQATRYLLYNAVRDSCKHSVQLCNIALYVKQCVRAVPTCSRALHAVQYLAVLHMLWLLLQGRGRPSLLSVASVLLHLHCDSNQNITTSECTHIVLCLVCVRNNVYCCHFYKQCSLAYTIQCN
jgi:hypothetical protein